MVTGHVEKRGKRGWSSLLIDHGYGPDGKRRRRRVAIKRPDGKPVTKAQAETELRRVLAEIDAGTYLEPSGFTVERWLARWLEGKCRLEPTTYRTYESVVRNHLLPYLPQKGEAPLQQLTSLQVDDVKRALLAEGLAASTVSRDLGVLRSALEEARVLKIVAQNVAKEVPGPPGEAAEVEPPDAPEILRLLALAAGSDLMTWCLVGLFAGTGQRISEVSALKWPAVDLETGTVEVREKRVQESRVGRTGKPKTKAGRRKQPLARCALEALRAIHRAQTEDKLRLGPAYRDQSYVLAHPDGRPLHPGWIRGRLAALGRLAGRRLHPHLLRHAYASLLLAEGGDLRTVQALMGHADPRSTMRYAHVLPGSKETAVAGLDAAFGHQVGTKPDGKSAADGRAEGRRRR
jgi:integrase